MDYDGLYRDLWMIRQHAHGDGDWCGFGDRWRELAQFLIDVDDFIDDLDSRGWS